MCHTGLETSSARPPTRAQPKQARGGKGRSTGGSERGTGRGRAGNKGRGKN